jgi:CheY-like chemotaxis protein
VTTVRDTGRGISPAMLPVIFDMFVQERQTIDRSHGGLGIGLAIVKNLVALHGGRVEAHSDGLGHGSTFVVRLPLASPEPHVESRHASATAAPPPGVAAGASRVLIIDDNEDAATLLADVLASVGYVCRIAHDGRRGLEIARAEEFDTILVDIGLPVMDGYEVARHLRSSPQGAVLQLIAVTGYGQESDKERAHAAGFDAHLVKPISVRQLSQILLQRR